MRVKPFTAETAAAAMASVRAELGDEAIIISVSDDKDNGSATVLVATDLSEFTTDTEAEIEELEDLGSLDPDETTRQALTYHGVPPRLAAKLAKAAGAADAANPTLALAAAFDTVFEFSLLPKNRPLMFVGPPGGGKTITVAKLCTEARMDGRNFQVATTDRQRAGGVEQLSAFTRILEVPLTALNSANALSEFISNQAISQPIYIDTQGVNPYTGEDMDALYKLVKAGRAEPVLVLPAGYDPMEAAEMARPFTDIGVKRMIVTRLDVARRAGGIVAAAYGAGMAFAEVSISPNVAERLSAINPVSLARIIMPHTDDKQTETSSSEAEI
jgi:flagellar biosynthesis protein FlhF